MKLRGIKLVRSNTSHSLPANSGFTLIELLIAIAITGLFAAIAIPNFLNRVDEAQINLLAEKVRQSLKEAQLQAMLEQQGYIVAFRKTPQGLQVGYTPASSQPNFPDDLKVESWQTLSSSIPSEQLIFTIPESFNDTIAFTPEGDTKNLSKVFLAIGNPKQPRVNTRRCINVRNSESGGSYFQIDKDSACDLSPNASPFTELGP